MLASDPRSSNSRTAVAEAEHRQRVELWIFALLEHRVNLWHCRRPAEHHLEAACQWSEARLEAGARRAQRRNIGRMEACSKGAVSLTRRGADERTTHKVNYGGARPTRWRAAHVAICKPAAEESLVACRPSSSF